MSAHPAIIATTRRDGLTLNFEIKSKLQKSPPEKRRAFLLVPMNLDFSKLDGLVAAVIQDHKTGRVLMVGFMNEEAWQKTVETGFATFYSRSRNKLWLKGETSGHGWWSRKSPPIAITTRC